MALITSDVCGWCAAAGVQETHEARRYLIHGMVQGVGFRYFAQRAAQRLGVTGYVKNLHDGRVEVYAIGGRAALSLLRAELGRGPRAAVVSSVIEEDAPLDTRFAHSFSIEHDAW